VPPRAHGGARRARRPRSHASQRPAHAVTPLWHKFI
jgi:hypothetical protein